MSKIESQAAGRSVAVIPHVSASGHTPKIAQCSRPITLGARRKDFPLGNMSRADRIGSTARNEGYAPSQGSSNFSTEAPSRIGALESVSRIQSALSERGIDASPTQIKTARALANQGITSEDDLKEAHKSGKLPSLAKGFTLIELLVVVSIISVLISITLPALTKARESARNIQCSSTIRSLLQAAHNYSVDYNDRFPATATDFSDNSSSYRIAAPDATPFSMGLLNHYLGGSNSIMREGDLQNYSCPGDPTSFNLEAMKGMLENNEPLDSPFFYRGAGHGRVPGPGIPSQNSGSTSLSDNSVIIDFNKNYSGFMSPSNYNHKGETVGIGRADGSVKRESNDTQSLMINTSGPTEMLRMWDEADSR